MSDSTAAERVGRYQLLEPIGIGPSGTVSRAKVFGVAGFERQFAVKRFHADLTAAATMAQSLSAAARAYGSLEHPRIARMSEFGVAQGQTFTAVEYVAGLDALRLVAEARVTGVTLAAGGALALVSQAARAIGYAHGRGLSHLGLSPTNVIITADGDVKITDFGILAATLPAQPINVARLANRIAYLTPEQLASEATSAATDVFALGVIAYELVTGQRTFRGDTPAQIAQSIMSGPPAEPALPRPIVRVLQRCLARSPFERFPDARALADALDAALRVAPVPGTRKDIGAQVASTLERLAALNDGAMSGVVALNLGTGPIPTRRAPDPQEDALSTTEFVRPDVPVAGPMPLTGLAKPDSPATTVPDLPRVPLTTMTGLPPPPIPVPAGLSSPPTPIPPPHPGGPNTLLGMQKPPPIPVVRGREVGGNVGAVPSLVRPRTGPVPTVSRSGDSGRLPAGARAARSEVPEDSVDIPTVGDPLASARAAQSLEVPDPGPPMRPSDASTVTARPSEFPTVIRPPIELPPVPDQRPPSDSQRNPAAPRTVTPQPRTPTPQPRPPSPRPLSSQPRTPTPPSVPIARPPARAASEPDTTTRPLFDPIDLAPPTPSPDLDPFPPPGEHDPFPPPGEHDPFPPPSESDLAGASQHILQIVAEPPTVPGVGPHRPPTQPPPMRPLPEPPMHATPLPEPVYTMPPPAQPVGASMVGARKSGSKVWLWIVTGLIVVAGAATVVAWKVFDVFGGEQQAVVKPAHDAQPVIDAAQVAIAPGDAEQAATAPGDAAHTATAPGDAAKVATTGDAPPADAPQVAMVADAGTHAPADAGGLTPTPGVGELVIASTPPGARVFLGGADQGVTPVRLPGTTDRHTIALVLPSHELYVAQVDGHGSFTIPLPEITPSSGPAGIKVLRCAKDRYYVFVDGKPTGQMCPTERIGCETGPHTVEVYDVISETRRKWEIEVKDTRLSYRVRVDGN